MKIQTELIIDKPLSLVVGLFGNQENEHLWQSSLISMYPDKFNPKMSHYHYEMNGRSIGVQIKIVQDRLPEIYELHCEMHGLSQQVKHRFNLCDDGTRWVVDTEFKANSLILKIAMLVAPKMFRQRTKDYMQEFKRFVEAQRVSEVNS